MFSGITGGKLYGYNVGDNSSLKILFITIKFNIVFFDITDQNTIDAREYCD